MKSDLKDWELVFLLHKEQLRSYLYRLTAHLQDTEDILHDTYVRSKENIESFNGNSSIKTWFFTIATNIAKDHWRVQKRWNLDAQDKCRTEIETNTGQWTKMIDAFESLPEQRFEFIEHLNFCFTCIAKNLDIEEQIAVILSEIYHFKRKEIALVLGKTEAVIKHLLFNGRKSLQIKYNNRCALINKQGTCYQCAELNDYFKTHYNSREQSIALISENSNSEELLSLRLKLISQIDPLTTNGAPFHDTLLQVLQEALEKA